MLFAARSHYDHKGVAGKSALVSNPRDSFFLLLSLWGALPLLIYVEGAAYQTSPSWIRITILQVES